MEHSTLEYRNTPHAEWLEVYFYFMILSYQKTSPLLHSLGQRLLFDYAFCSLST